MVRRTAPTMRSVQTDDTTDDQPARQAVQRTREIAVSDLRFVMGNKQGRRFVGQLLASAGLYQRSFTGTSETFFKEGRRSVALDLLGEISQHCHADYLLMLQEAKK